MKNKYIKVTHISEQKTRAIIRYFSLDIEAKKVAELTGVSQPTINWVYKAIRKRIAALCEAESPFENGKMKLDESYFGARRVRSNPGHGAAEKPRVRNAQTRRESTNRQTEFNQRIIADYKEPCRFRYHYLQRRMQNL